MTLVRFDSFTFDPDAGELTKSGRVLKLQPQPTRLLALLVERAGHIVTREEIQHALWNGDTFVDYDQSINFCIKRIREVLGDDKETPRFVETVPRRGYRFVAPVTGGSQRRSSRWPLAVAIGGALLVAVALVRAPVESTGDVPASRTRPFTSYEGFEWDPAFSPDGRQIAYTWDGSGDGYSHIYVKLVAGGEPLQLTDAQGHDWYPAWSADGSQIAFLRNTTVRPWGGFENRKLEVLTIPALGGAERLVGETADDVSLTWHPDGQHLIIGANERPPKGLSLLSLRTGETRPLTFPAEKTALHDVAPEYSPDGTMLAFKRGPNSSLGVGDLFVQPVTGGEPKRLTIDNRQLHGFGWTPDSKGLVLSASTAFDSQLFHVSIDGGAPTPLPGTEGAKYPTLAAEWLAFVRDVNDFNLWRVNGPTAETPSPPEKLIASTRADRFPEYSPDGTRIAFVSNRDGETAIWLADASGAGQRRLAGPAHFPVPRWSPGGDEIAYSAKMSEDNVDIFVTSVRGGPARNVTTSESVDVFPGWSPDGRWIYFHSLRTGSWEIWRVPSHGGQARQITREGGQMPVALQDRVYFWRGWQIWSVPPHGGEATLALETRFNIWTVWREKIVYVNRIPDHGTVIEMFDPDTGETQEIASVGELAITFLRSVRLSGRELDSLHAERSPRKRHRSRRGISILNPSRLRSLS